MHPRSSPKRDGRFGVLALASLLVVFLLLISACVAPRRAATPTHAILLDVPAITQEEAHECGLASLAMLTLHHETELSAEVAEALRAEAARNEGLSGAAVRDALERSGLEAYVLEGRLDDSAAGVYHHLDRGRPVLAHLAGDGDGLHAVLVTGYDPLGGSVGLLDPERGEIWVSADSFEESWRDAGRFALIAVPRNQLTEEERLRLQELEDASSEKLEEQVAGDLSNDDLGTVLLVLGIVVLVVILL